jgi:hypothetical protein
LRQYLLQYTYLFYILYISDSVKPAIEIKTYSNSNELETKNQKAKARSSTTQSNSVQNKDRIFLKTEQTSSQSSGNFVTPLPTSHIPEKDINEPFQIDIELPPIVIHSDDYVDEVKGPFSDQEQLLKEEKLSFQALDGKDQITDDENTSLNQLHENIAGPSVTELTDAKDDSDEFQYENISIQDENFYDQTPDKVSSVFEQKGVFAPKQTVFLSQPLSVSLDENLFQTDQFSEKKPPPSKNSLPSSIFVTPMPKNLSQENLVKIPDTTTLHNEIKRIGTSSSTTNAPTLAFSTLLPPSSLKQSPAATKEEGFLGLVYASTTTKKPRTSYKNNAPAPELITNGDSTETFEETSEDEPDNNDDFTGSFLQPRLASGNLEKYSPPPEAAFASTYKAPLNEDYEDQSNDLSFSSLLGTSQGNSHFPSTFDSATQLSASSSKVTDPPNINSQSTFENVFLIKSTEKPQVFSSIQDEKLTLTTSINIGDQTEPNDSYGSPIAEPLASIDDTNYFQLGTNIASIETTSTTFKPNQNPQSVASQEKNNAMSTIPSAKYGPKPTVVDVTTSEPKPQPATTEPKVFRNQPAKTIQPAKLASSNIQLKKDTPTESNTLAKPERLSVLHKTAEAPGVYDWPITSDPTIIDFTRDHKHPTIR